MQALGDGRPGRFVADRFSHPRTFRSAHLALDVFHRAAAPAARPAPAEPNGVFVPDLALGAATGSAPPTLRGLGDPHRDYALGSGLVHLTQPGRTSVRVLEQRGRFTGWTEVGCRNPRSSTCCWPRSGRSPAGRPNRY